MTLLTHKEQEGPRCKRPSLGRARAFSPGTIPPLCPTSDEGSYSNPNPGWKKASNVFISPRGHGPSGRGPALPKSSGAGGEQCLVSLPGRYSEAGRRLESQETAKVQLCSLLGTAGSHGPGRPVPGTLI